MAFNLFDNHSEVLHLLTKYTQTCTHANVSQNNDYGGDTLDNYVGDTLDIFF